MFRRALIATACAGSAIALYACGGTDSNTPVTSQNALQTATPIKHLVVIYGENVSFDHYFGTYPNATNPPGEPAFSAASGTPSVNGLSGLLLTTNPNATNPANGTGATNPFRLDRTQAATADQNHAYTAEEQAYDNGLADLFPKYTGNGSSGGAGAFGTTGQVMGYFDGNTVTALWNYAQRFAMSDNAYTSTYGPSTPGALNVIAGQTDGMQIVKTSKAVSTLAKTSYYINDGQGGLTMINDVDPGYDVCSSTTDQAMMSGKNIGDLLNARNVTWGGFMGGFNLQTTNANGTTGCKRSTIATAVNAATSDYIPHHNWFQYYASTANPQHTRPSSIAAIGSSVETDGKTPEPANHQYDSDDFFAAVKAGNFPSVSFLKAPAAQDAHAGYSDPLDEQQFVTKVVNFLQQQPDWANTAVIITYDDSDGWYDHAYTAPTRASFDAVDQLNGNGVCGSGTATTGVGGAPVNGRCGPGTRIPFVVVSPWAKQNYVSHTLIDQASVVRFIEDNWLGGQRIGGGSFDATAGDMRDLFDFSGTVNKAPLYLDPALGTKLATAPSI
ncbi:phospholipase C [Burkholderia thailandensis]|uniref:Phosphoesterase family protein n=1 Tax=Burkholderia thailandensis (strain ATCC 700388 / DSM 13276 / CCUG 48851 / CIP 106301 / E264) TaxID=271848 RepID=Q2T4R9_BURTA|nr:alkaline phosphatase family protein [Burkholderia thailandensis]ABC34468.1 phosphoesterase family protein [Burkholderia thailandensis E264]AHI75855.1 phosphoesterase family protein [Burkholderia thailandensis 2002721723]AIC90317.1 phosphoesterase family protein [Burkholderia thailandensis USAMRU Malaysia \